MTSKIRYAEACPDGQIIRHSIDEVGNDLTAELRWCATHVEPVWVYGDGHYHCYHDLVVRVDTQDHFITDGLWATGPRPGMCRECGRGFRDPDTPRWDEDTAVISHGWLAGRCGNCGAEL